jgi:hypothetical protein
LLEINRTPDWNRHSASVKRGQRHDGATEVLGLLAYVGMATWVPDVETKHIRNIGVALEWMFSDSDHKKCLDR